jgi:4,5-dihydroxyphthalate decarboxylase
MAISAASKPKHLRTLLGDHPHTAALKTGAVTSDRIALDFIPYSPTNKGFKPMVREQAFDVSEMAIVTYLIAKSFDKPMVLLPAVMVGRFQHRYALYNPEHGHLKVSDLRGKRVGIRSFTTTTGAWLRGILANDYDVDLDGIQWVSFEEPHVAEYVDATERAPPGKNIIQMLLDGELDAVIGETSDDPRLKPLFDDVVAQEKAWFARHGVVPVNHFVVVSSALAASDPQAVREVFSMLQQSKRAIAAADPDPIPFGLENLRKSLGLIVGYAAQQRLIPRAFSVDELFDDVTRTLG